MITIYIKILSTIKGHFDLYCLYDVVDGKI